MGAPLPSKALQALTGAAEGATERDPAHTSTPTFSLVRVTKAGGPLSKTARLTESGAIEVDASASAMSRGVARTVQIQDGMAGLARLYAGLGPNEAVVFSNASLGSEARELCTEAQYAERSKLNPNVVTRTKRFLGAVAAPGLQLFEVDDHGLPPGMTPPDAERMVALLDELLPELEIRSAARLLTHSSSSFIFEKETGRQLKGEGGKHLAMLLSDLSKARALRDLLEVRQWANGYGHIHLSRDGRQLERTAFDLAVFTPERLVFEAGAILEGQLEQRRPAAQVTEGHALDMSRLPLPTLAEREKAAKAKEAAKARSAAAAQQAREKYIESEGAKIATERGISAAEAQRIVTVRAETASLDDGDTLIFTDTTPETVQTVRHVLDNIEQYAGRPIRDPVEPEAGRSKAMILRGPGGRPFISSFVHGGRRYTFERIVDQRGAADEAVFALTDLANAHRLAKAFGNDLIATAAGWFVFNGRHWERGDHLAEARAMNLSRLIIQDPRYGRLVDQHEKAQVENERRKLGKLIDQWEKFAAQSENRSRIQSALELLKTLQWRDIAELNPSPWLFNVLNGTLDLRSGVLRAHDREDLITTLAPVEYDPNATCPTFENALSEMLGNDPSLVAFAQRFFGYCLTGATTEQKILIPWGDGSNGKSTILGVVQNVMGRDYAGMAAPKLLEGTRSDRHPTEIADLYGKRLVIASETEEGAQLREAFLKLATGSDPLKGRFMRQDFFEFTATHKFVLLTNHKPEVKGTDYAIWRRLLLLPFEVIFGDEAAIAKGEAMRPKDQALPEKLAMELEGVLAWMVRGCMEWQKSGLSEPDKVIGATESYREEQDRIGQFIAEYCELDGKGTVLQGDLYRRYQLWAHRNGYHPVGSGKFRKQLLKATKGQVQIGRTTAPPKNVATYVGIRVPDDRFLDPY